MYSVIIQGRNLHMKLHIIGIERDFLTVVLSGDGVNSKYALCHDLSRHMYSVISQGRNIHMHLHISRREIKCSTLVFLGRPNLVNIIDLLCATTRHGAWALSSIWHQLPIRLSTVVMETVHLILVTHLTIWHGVKILEYFCKTIQ